MRSLSAASPKKFARVSDFVLNRWGGGFLACGFQFICDPPPRSVMPNTKFLGNSTLKI